MSVWLAAALAKIATDPKVMGALPSFLRSILSSLFADHAAAAESKAATDQAKAASAIADNAARAEALRVASKKLSDDSSR